MQREQNFVTGRMTHFKKTPGTYWQDARYKCQHFISFNHSFLQCFSTLFMKGMKPRFFFPPLIIVLVRPKPIFHSRYKLRAWSLWLLGWRYQQRLNWCTLRCSPFSYLLPLHHKPAVPYHVPFLLQCDWRKIRVLKPTLCLQSFSNSFALFCGQVSYFLECLHFILSDA